jgi:hypothetical protein
MSLRESVGIMLHLGAWSKKIFNKDFTGRWPPVR